MPSLSERIERLATYLLRRRAEVALSYGYVNSDDERALRKRQVKSVTRQYRDLHARGLLPSDSYGSGTMLGSLYVAYAVRKEIQDVDEEVYKVRVIEGGEGFGLYHQDTFHVKRGLIEAIQTHRVSSPHVSDVLVAVTYGEHDPLKDTYSASDAEVKVSQSGLIPHKPQSVLLRGVSVIAGGNSPCYPKRSITGRQEQGNWHFEVSHQGSLHQFQFPVERSMCQELTGLYERIRAGEQN